MYRPLDLHGREVGGLFEACGATNPLYRRQQPEVQFAALHAAAQSGVLPAMLLGAVDPAAVLGEMTSPSAGPAAGSWSAAVQAAKAQEDGHGEGAEPSTTMSTTAGSKRKKGARRIGATSTQSGQASLQVKEASLATVQNSTPKSASKKLKQTFCVCKSPYDEKTGLVMIACDGICEDWFHPECLGYHGKDYRDVDGSKLEQNSSSRYFCPWCELSRGGNGEQAEKRSSASVRLARWCDASDLGDESLIQEEPIPPPSASNSHNAPATRWKVLLEARASLKAPIAECSQCKQRHHPVLPCAVKTSAATSKFLDNSVTESAVPFPFKLNPVNDLYGLVIAGKYHTLKGTIVGTSRKWSQIKLDDEASTLIPVPNHHILTSKVPFATKSDEDSLFSVDNTNGITAATGGGYVAFLDLDETHRIILGRYASWIRAARVHDFAARLQFGEEDVSLNFNDMHRQPITVDRRVLSTLWDSSLALAHQIALGPFANINPSHGNLNTDALTVQEWCDLMLTELDALPGYFPRSEKNILLIQSAVDESANLQAKKLVTIFEVLAKRFEDEKRESEKRDGEKKEIEISLESENSTTVTNPTPATSISDGSDGEDELSVHIKKYARSRSAKQKRA